jgi:uncharacterized protein
MRPLPTLTFAIASLALVAGSASPAAAFDTINCQRDHSVAERAICDSQRLQVLDAQVTDKYTDIMLDSHIKSDVKQRVHESQISFLRRRDQCGRDTECLADVMERRATRINYYR